jgi:hypothetical protein
MYSCFVSHSAALDAARAIDENLTVLLLGVAHCAADDKLVPGVGVRKTAAAC